MLDHKEEFQCTHQADSIVAFLEPHAGFRIATKNNEIHCTKLVTRSDTKWINFTFI